MNKVCVELSDEAMADLQEAQLQLRTLWKGTPKMEDREVTEADAIRNALSAFVSEIRNITDIMPPGNV